jgi:hypothetical protein
VIAGGYQVQFVPGFVKPLLELCLSHHDELRSNAVMVVGPDLLIHFDIYFFSYFLGHAI